MIMTGDYIPFEIVDSAGRLNPTAQNLVRFKLSGPGVLAAVGNGDPASLESFQQPQRRAWEGRGLLIVKSTRKTGTIRVTASGEGLKAGTAEIKAR